MFDYVVEYKKGVENKVADALSRREEAEVNSHLDLSCRVTSVVEPSWLDEVKKMAPQSQFFKELQTKANEGKLSLLNTN